MAKYLLWNRFIKLEKRSDIHHLFSMTENIKEIVPITNKTVDRKKNVRTKELGHNKTLLKT